MTLILATVQKPQVVVMCADKRIVDANGLTDNFQKLIALGATGLGSAYGGPRLVDKKTGDVHFDTYDVMTRYFKEKQATRTEIVGFQAAMITEYADYIKQKRGGVPPKGDWHLCHVIIMALEGDDTYCHLLTCSVEETQGLSVGRSSNKCTNSRLHGYGDEGLLDAITHPHRLLSGLHTDADMRRMIGENAPFENASVDRSVEMLRTINKACFDNATPITRLDSTISAKCNVGVLTKDGIELHPESFRKR